MQSKAEEKQEQRENESSYQRKNRQATDAETKRQSREGENADPIAKALKNEKLAEQRRIRDGLASGEKKMAITQHETVPKTIKDHKLGKMRYCTKCGASLYANEPDSFCCDNG